MCQTLPILVFRAACLFTFSTATVLACSCWEPSVKDKLQRADVVFRGTIVELRDVGDGKPTRHPFHDDSGKLVVFRVSRVWKGPVGYTFEMPGILETSACIGFWPDYMKIGADPLVYASRFDADSGAYTIQICGDHKKASEAEKDFKVLGTGKPPPAPQPAKRP